MVALNSVVRIIGRNTLVEYSSYDRKFVDDIERIAQAIGFKTERRNVVVNCKGARTIVVNDEWRMIASGGEKMQEVYRLNNP